MKKNLIPSLIIAAFSTGGYVFGVVLANGGGMPGGEKLAMIVAGGAAVAALTFVILTLAGRLARHAIWSNPVLRENVAAYSTIAVTFAFAGLAFIIAAGTGISPVATFALTFEAVVWGIAATVPMLALLVALETIKHPAVHAFRDQQIAYFANMGFRLTPLRIVLISLGAGIGEELLFRGALQAWLGVHIPLVFAVLIPAIIFGLMHNLNRIYMILAGLIGVYLGVVFIVSGNILVPILAHTLYDIIALAYTAKLIAQRQNGDKMHDA